MKLAPIFTVGLALLLAACGLDATGSTAKEDSYEATVRQADVARKSGDLDTAIPLYGRALQANPQGVEAKLGLGQSYLTLGAGDEAAAQFRDVLARHGGDPTARRGLASALIWMGQPDLAEQQLQAALQADPNDYRALNAMGIVLDMQGRHAEAQDRYRAGIAIAPEFIALRSNLGLSLAITGLAPEAIAQLEPIASGLHSDGRIRQNLAFAYAMAGDMEHALQISRHDLPEIYAQRQLSYYLTLRSLPIELRSAEIRRNPAFFPQSSRST
jgi:Flp pilus assembly protein TadD